MTPQHNAEQVLLLHGLCRTAWSMKRIEWSLRAEGYQVINLSYPSTRLSVQQAADQLAGVLEANTSSRAAKIHFVTHSLGSIVVRQYLRDHPLDNLGRIVMLAPPNQGSELADKLKRNVLFRLCTGPAGRQLGTGPGSLPRQLGSAPGDVGIIAGDRSLNPLFSACLPGPDDGKVSVAGTRLDGMSDFLVVHHTHTWMMWRQPVVKAVMRFLETGRFAGAWESHMSDRSD